MKIIVIKFWEIYLVYVCVRVCRWKKYYIYDCSASKNVDNGRVREFVLWHPPSSLFPALLRIFFCFAYFSLLGIKKGPSFRDIADIRWIFFFFLFGIQKMSKVNRDILQEFRSFFFFSFLKNCQDDKFFW